MEPAGETGGTKQRRAYMEILNFNLGWTFWNRECPGAKKQIDLPHDAMIHEKRIAGLVAGETSGYFPGGFYIYEKHFRADEKWREKKLVLEFEGIYQKAEIFLNDRCIGKWIYGYTDFYVDLTEDILWQQENILRVLVDNTQTPNSRWYTGSGIYRNVNLYLMERECILPGGIRITTLSYDPAVIEVECELSKEALAREAHLHFQVEKNGACVAEKRMAASEQKCRIEIPDARLWDADHPERYILRAGLEIEGKCHTAAEEVFGIRKLEWSTARGLCINGRAIKLRGCCVHHDNGILGACEFENTAYRKIEKLKEAGYNAIRSSHNPISKPLLRACDELGMYILDEFTDVWRGSKNDYDYSLYFDQEWEKDVTAMVRKDYNHPSVIMYSTGNEVYDIAAEEGALVQRQLADAFRNLDGTRPITNGINVLAALSKPKKKPIQKPKYTPEDIVDPHRIGKPSPLVGSKLLNLLVTLMPKLQERVQAKHIVQNLGAFTAPLDIVGLNYGMHLAEPMKREAPDTLLLHTETFPKSIGRTWRETMQQSHVVGDFMWTGWDYLGETGIGVPQYGDLVFKMNKPWPCLASGTGSINLAGFIEGQGHYSAVVYGEEKQPYIGVHPVNHAREKCLLGTWRGTDVVNSWSWEGYEGEKARIDVFSDQDLIELIQDGKSLGKVKVKEYRASFETVYLPGTLIAVAYDKDGIKRGESRLQTAEKETRLQVKVRETQLIANGKDVAHLEIELTDAKGVRKVTDNREVTVQVEGSGVLQGIGSGNPVSERDYTGNSCIPYYGQLLAVVRSTGKAGDIRVHILAEGLEEQIVDIKVVES